MGCAHEVSVCMKSQQVNVARQVALEKQVPEILDNQVGLSL